MVKLSDIVKLQTQRNVYAQFAKKYCNITLTKKRIDSGMPQIFIKDVEAYSIYEKCLNEYRGKKEVFFIASIIKDFFDNQ